jgi:hypothetical protein
MRRTTTASLWVLAAAGVLVLGFAVSGLASSGGATGPLAETSEETTEATTEGPVATKWRAALTTAQEVPRPQGVKAGAGGTFAVTVTEDGGKYSASFKLVYKNLTGKAVAAHVHKGKPGKNGPVVVTLCGRCPNGKTGTASVSKAVVAAMKAGAAYVNVHTAKNPNGEIRGQVKKIG